MELSNGFVVVMGMGVVFFGLICMVFLLYLVSAICKALGRIEKSVAPEAPAVPAAPAAPAAAAGTDIPNRPEFIAAVSAAIAEMSGTDMKAIRIRSVKKI